VPVTQLQVNILEVITSHILLIGMDIIRLIDILLITDTIVGKELQILKSIALLYRSIGFF
jgi:hypothetical protein